MTQETQDTTQVTQTEAAEVTEATATVAVATTTNTLLNKHNLALAELAPKDKSRYSLSGILVGANGTVVTNGHYLVHVTLPATDKERVFPQVEGFTPAASQDVKDFILPTDVAKEIAKSLPKKTAIPVLNHACLGQGNAIATTDLDNPRVFRKTEVEGQYPNWQAVLPKEDELPRVRICLDAAYLAQMCKLYVTFAADERSTAVVLEIFSPQRAVRMTGENKTTGQKWMSLLQPIHEGGRLPKDCSFATVEADVTSAWVISGQAH